MIRTTARFAIRSLNVRPVSCFAGDSWRDRDEAAERVYINQKESKFTIMQDKH